MARFHLLCHSRIGVGRTEDHAQAGGIPITGEPADDPQLYDVVAAGKIALPPGTLYVSVEAITGSVYAITGFDDDTIAAPAGNLAREGAGANVFGVGGTSANRHTHLHVIEASPASDTAVDLNA